MARPTIVLVVAVIATAVAPGACRRADGAPGHAGERSGYVDSALSVEVALQRFRTGLDEPRSLNGPTGREALVRQLITTLEASDTTSLMKLALTRGEFAYLYYPTAREALPPYELSPQLMWFLLQGRTVDDGFRALEDFGGRPFGYAGHSCGEPRWEGENRVWGFCRVRRLLPSGDMAEVALFGLILERAGRFKFVSLANKLD